jgi:hypothetical protein
MYFYNYYRQYEVVLKYLYWNPLSLFCRHEYLVII